MAVEKASFTNFENSLKKINGKNKEIYVIIEKKKLGVGFTLKPTALSANTTEPTVLL